MSMGQEQKNRKILEQLEEQKKRLRMGGHPGPANPIAISTPPAVQQPALPANPSSTLVMETHNMTPAQRAALQHANANSFGYFITQDSSFGNLILPVIPRFKDV
ncbi:SOSS complex subunit C homolog [Mytilus trossulus]|uniref:SOSS complex subunit C homolog n=1 Tax=Mytilus trossulus TaxID=6551 RepID=UPI0030053C33